MATLGKLFPVCCAADLSEEVMNRFIQANSKDDFNCVLVDSLTDEYTNPSEEIEGTSDPSSPFKGKTVHECYELLMQLREDTDSDINFDCFAVMDERSMEDDTLLLAQGPAEEDGEAESVRVPFDHASHLLFNYLAGTADISEHRERGEAAADGVCRLW